MGVGQPNGIKSRILQTWHEIYPSVGTCNSRQGSAASAAVATNTVESGRVTTDIIWSTVEGSSVDQSLSRMMDRINSP